MSPIILDEQAIERLLPAINVQKALTDMFAELASKTAVQPPQSVSLFPSGQGDVIAYQGILENHGVFGAKLSPYIANDDKAIVTAWTCLMSMQTGQPLLLCDAAKLTTERTAATTAIAVDQLSQNNSKILTIIGSGAVAIAHWHHAARLRNWQEVRVWSPRLANDSQRQQQWSKLSDIITISDSVEHALLDSDVVMLCTSSGTPVIDTDNIVGGTLITSISTNLPGAHEVDPEFLNKAQVYCDYKETTPASAGEMLLATKKKGWSAERIKGDLPGLVAKQCEKPDTNTPVFFRSLGLGLEDIAIANEIYLAHKKAEA